MVGNIENVFCERVLANQISDGAKQINYGVQTLVKGSNEQLSDSGRRIAEQMSQNTCIARETTDTLSLNKQTAEKGNKQLEQLEQLMQVVSDLNESRRNLGKMFDIINDISTQTLNMVIEVACAGQHANNIAGGVKDVGGLIENSITKANIIAFPCAVNADSFDM